jgi:FAD/FMN-containing dehydrogenase
MKRSELRKALEAWLTVERYEAIEKLMTLARAAGIKTIPRGSGAGSYTCMRVAKSFNSWRLNSSSHRPFL